MIDIPTMAFPPTLTEGQWNKLSEAEKTSYARWRYASRQYLRRRVSPQNGSVSSGDIKRL